MNRRTFSMSMALGTGLLIASGLLTGCGFQLQQPPRMAFETATLSGFAINSPTAAELARALENAGVAVVETSSQAALQRSSVPAATVPLTSHVVIQALGDQRQQTSSSLTSFSQVREINLVNTLKFRVLRADGSVLSPATTLTIANPMVFNERDALAKQYEAESLHQALQTDLVRQMLRRLAAITPEQLKAPSPNTAAGAASAP